MRKREPKSFLPFVDAEQEAFAPLARLHFRADRVDMRFGDVLVRYRGRDGPQARKFDQRRLAGKRVNPVRIENAEPVIEGRPAIAEILHVVGEIFQCLYRFASLGTPLEDGSKIATDAGEIRLTQFTFFDRKIDCLFYADAGVFEPARRIDDAAQRVVGAHDLTDKAVVITVGVAVDGISECVIGGIIVPIGKQIAGGVELQQRCFVGIENAEFRIEAKQMKMLAKHPGTEGVESADIRPVQQSQMPLRAFIGLLGIP